jgi:hypothetical protein
MSDSSQHVQFRNILTSEEVRNFKKQEDQAWDKEIEYDVHVSRIYRVEDGIKVIRKNIPKGESELVDQIEEQIKKLVVLADNKNEESAAQIRSQYALIERLESDCFSFIEAQKQKQ